MATIELRGYGKDRDESCFNVRGDLKSAKYVAGLLRDALDATDWGKQIRVCYCDESEARDSFEQLAPFFRVYLDMSFSVYTFIELLMQLGMTSQEIEPVALIRIERCKGR